MNTWEKYRQVRKEAGATGVFLAVLIVFWLVAGFGVYAFAADVRVLYIPLWAVLGTFGVWLFAICGVRLLLSAVFRDMDLKEARHE